MCRQQQEGIENSNDENNNKKNKLLELGGEATKKGQSYFYSFMNGARLGVKGMYRFLKDPWNLIDVANIIILIISLIVWMVFIASHSNKINMGSPDYFLDIQNNDNVAYTASLLVLYQRTVSFNLILISFKVLKYLGVLIERVTVMFKVISHAQSDILYFFALYLIIFISFTTTFHILYGSQVERFSTYGDSFNTLFLYLGRNILQIEEMKEMSFNFTVIYFIIFITSMEFILMNMFIAIIALSYSTVNKQMKEKNLDKTLEYAHFSVRFIKFYQYVSEPSNIYSS